MAPDPCGTLKKTLKMLGKLIRFLTVWRHIFQTFERSFFLTFFQEFPSTDTVQKIIHIYRRCSIPQITDEISFIPIASVGVPDFEKPAANWTICVLLRDFSSCLAKQIRKLYLRVKIVGYTYIPQVTQYR